MTDPEHVSDHVGRGYGTLLYRRQFPGPLLHTVTAFQLLHTTSTITLLERHAWVEFARKELDFRTLRFAYARGTRALRSAVPSPSVAQSPVSLQRFRPFPSAAAAVIQYHTLSRSHSCRR